MLETQATFLFLRRRERGDLIGKKNLKRTYKKKNVPQFQSVEGRGPVI